MKKPAQSKLSTILPRAPKNDDDQDYYFNVRRKDNAQLVAKQRYYGDKMTTSEEDARDHPSDVPDHPSLAPSTLKDAVDYMTKK
jgi:hypothetical protein